MIINQKRFVLFRLPHQDSVQLWHLNKFQEGTDFFTFHSFDNQEHIQLSATTKLTLSYDDLKAVQFEFALQNYQGVPPAMSKEAYLGRANNFIQKLNESSFEKIILSRVKLADEIKDLGLRFRSLCQKYPTAFVYIFHDNHDTWLGASPEKLLVSNQKHYETVALAGTKSSEENRDWTQKEYKEHDIVVQYITSKFKPNQIDQKGPYTINLGEIQHLKTDIHILDEQISVDKVLNLLHPTPAVCGIPKDKTKAYILENEGYDRQFYTGYFGIQTKHQSIFYVNLRCAQLFHDKTALYVGGGLIAESNALSEWKETELKAKALI